MDLGLSGRVYLLTGASRGLGFATAEQLVADGARVVIAARDEKRLEAAAAALNATAAHRAAACDSTASRTTASRPAASADAAVAVVADLGDPQAPERLVSTALNRFGRLDGALLSVGGPPPGTALAVTDEQWTAAFGTVFLGAIRTARVVTGHLGPGGVIGFVLSSSSRSPITGLGISNGLRPGLLGAAKDMADELAPRGIRVVSLLPGRIATDRSAELIAAAADPIAAKAQVEAAIPLRRQGTPAEFGQVAAFVLSPAASYLTGLAIPVDGGAGRPL